MIEYFGAILGVPSAVDAALNLLARIRERKDLSETTAQDINKAESELSAVKASLAEFAVAFDELEAWKWLHDISSKMKHQLGDTFAHRIAMETDPQGYEKTYYEMAKPTIERECKNLYLQEGAIGLLQDKLDNGKLTILDSPLRALEVPGPQPRVLKNAWHSELKEAVSLLATQNTDPERVFKQIMYLDRFIGTLNMRANRSILTAVTEYARIINELRGMLHLEPNDA